MIDSVDFIYVLCNVMDFRKVHKGCHEQSSGWQQIKCIVFSLFLKKFQSICLYFKENSFLGSLFVSALNAYWRTLNPKGFKKIKLQKLQIFSLIAMKSEIIFKSVSTKIYLTMLGSWNSCVQDFIIWYG